jgi:hypothetical protein
MFSLRYEFRSYIVRIIEDDDASQVLSDSLKAFKETRSPSEFVFLMSRFGSFESIEDCVTSHINQESDRKSAHDIHRSELWRRAVISATDVKHSDPMLFADKVLSHYDEKFNIK